MSVDESTRRHTLERFVATKPTDAFARYGLALECVKLGDNDSAVSHFRTLLENSPSYLAGYFQLGQLLGRIGRLEEARRILSDGIVQAQKSGDAHTRDEMEAALAMLR